MAKTRTKQGRAKRGTTKTMKKAARQRVTNPVRERKFPDKTESRRPLPGETPKGSRSLGQGRQSKPKTSSPKRNAK